MRSEGVRSASRSRCGFIQHAHARSNHALSWRFARVKREPQTRHLSEPPLLCGPLGYSVLKGFEDARTRHAQLDDAILRREVTRGKHTEIIVLKAHRGTIQRGTEYKKVRNTKKHG